MRRRFVVAVEGLCIDDDVVVPTAHVVLDLDCPYEHRVVTRQGWDPDGARRARAYAAEAEAP